MGATGLLGTALINSLLKSGAAVTGFSRRRHSGSPGMGQWNPEAGTIDAERLEGASAVVNLAGENLAEGRWTPARKQQLWASRVDSTALLCRTLAALDHPPRVLLNASAIGFYGDRGENAVDEDSPPGSGFVADLCKDWEAATELASSAGVRVVCLRFGVVLSPNGGALAKMLPAFRLGLGARLGHGEQRMPWITITDAVAAVRFALQNAELTGPLNVVSPESVSNAQFTEALGSALGRPAALKVPGFALKAMFGAEMAREVLLSGANVRPRRLEIGGFRFEHPRLDDALLALLG